MIRTKRILVAYSDQIAAAYTAARQKQPGDWVMTLNVLDHEKGLVACHAVLRADAVKAFHAACMEKVARDLKTLPRRPGAIPIVVHSFMERPPAGESKDVTSIFNVMLPTEARKEMKEGRA
jgi:hypothetical protein